MGSRQGSPGAVTITLHTAKEDCDEKAKVRVELDNPDAMVEKMLMSLAQKFPAESVMTIEKEKHGAALISSSSAPSSRQPSGGAYAGRPYDVPPHQHHPPRHHHNADRPSPAAILPPANHYSTTSPGGSPSHMTNAYGTQGQGYATSPRHYGIPTTSGSLGMLSGGSGGNQQGGSTPMSPRVVKIPAPSYPLLDGSRALLAVGPDGRPIDNHCQDPITGGVLPVGAPVYDEMGRLVPEIITDVEGRQMKGKALAPEGLHHGRMPLPHYLTSDGRWVPMFVDQAGQLMHGYCLDSGEVRAVGLQVVDGACRTVPGQVVGPDGRQCSGVALSTLEVDNNGQITGQFKPSSNTQQPQMQQHPVQSSSLSGQGVSVPSRTVHPDGRRETCVTTWDAEGELRVRYIEVPIVTEEVKRVKKQEVVEVLKYVPKPIVVDVDKIVEVPEVQVVYKEVPIDEIEEVVVHQTVKQIVEKPIETVVTRPVIREQIVEKIVEVPGPIKEVPVIQRVERPIPVAVYQDSETPTIVAQKLQPKVRVSQTVKKVDCVVTQPKVITVDVVVPKPVPSTIVATGTPRETHRVVDIPAAQFNSLSRKLNADLDMEHLLPLFIRDGAGVPILPATEKVEIIPPASSDWHAGHRPGQIHCHMADGVVLPELRIRTDRQQQPQHLPHQTRQRYIESAAEETTATFTNSGSSRHSRRSDRRCRHGHRKTR